MTTTDISLCVQQVCSTWRARYRSTNSRNALRGTCLAAQIFLHTSTVAIPWRLTLPLHSRNYSKTRPPTLNSVIFFLYIWPVIPLLFNYSFSVFFSGLMDYKYIYNQHQISIQKAIQWGTKRGNQYKLADYKRQSQMFRWSRYCVYGKPIWNTGAARRSRQFRRYFPREVHAAKADAKLGSSTKDRLGGLARGLDTSNLRGNFTGLRVIFLFPLLEGERTLLGLGEPRAGGPTGTYSTRPSSTTSDILTPGLDAVSFRGVPLWYQRSLVSLVAQRCNTTRSQQAHRSDMTWLADADATKLHGAYTGLDVMLSAIATESDNMLKPVSEKKLLCMKCGLRTKSCTQSRTPRNSSFLMATRSKLMVNSSHCAEDPRITSVVNWNTWNTEPHRRMRQYKGVQATSQTGYYTYFIQVPTSAKTSLSRTERQDVTYVRAAPRGRPLQLPLFLHKKLVLSSARLNLSPPGPTLLQQPIQELVEKL